MIGRVFKGKKHFAQLTLSFSLHSVDDYDDTYRHVHVHQVI